MKKQIVTLLCTIVLMLGLAVVPALASTEPYCPIMVEAYTYGPFDELRINKVYQLSERDDPSNIPTEDFERGGRRYYLLDLAVDDTDYDRATYTATFGSVELTRGEKYAKASNQSENLTSYSDTTGNEAISDLLPVLGCAGSTVMVAVIVLCTNKGKKM